MSTARAGEYKANMRQSEQERVERAKRIALFIATTDAEIVADLFAEVRDALLDKEADEVFYLTKFYKALTTALDEVEREFCT